MRTASSPDLSPNTASRIVTANTASRIVTANTASRIITPGTTSGIITASIVNTASKIITADTANRIITADTASKIITANTANRIIKANTANNNSAYSDCTQTANRNRINVANNKSHNICFSNSNNNRNISSDDTLNNNEHSNSSNDSAADTTKVFDNSQRHVECVTCPKHAQDGGDTTSTYVANDTNVNGDNTNNTTAAVSNNNITNNYGNNGNIDNILYAEVEINFHENLRNNQIVSKIETNLNSFSKLKRIDVSGGYTDPVNSNIGFDTNAYISTNDNIVTQANRKISNESLGDLDSIERTWDKVENILEESQEIVQRIKDGSINRSYSKTSGINIPATGSSTEETVFQRSLCENNLNNFNYPNCRLPQKCLPTASSSLPNFSFASYIPDLISEQSESDDKANNLHKKCDSLTQCCSIRDKSPDTNHSQSSLNSSPEHLSIDNSFCSTRNNKYSSDHKTSVKTHPSYKSIVNENEYSLSRSLSHINSQSNDSSKVKCNRTSNSCEQLRFNSQDLSPLSQCDHTRCKSETHLTNCSCDRENETFLNNSVPSILEKMGNIQAGDSKKNPKLKDKDRLKITKGKNSSRPSLLDSRDTLVDEGESHFNETDERSEDIPLSADLPEAETNELPITNVLTKQSEEDISAFITESFRRAKMKESDLEKQNINDNRTSKSLSYQTSSSDSVFVETHSALSGSIIKEEPTINLEKNVNYRNSSTSPSDSIKYKFEDSNNTSLFEVLELTNNLPTSCFTASTTSCLPFRTTQSKTSSITEVSPLIAQSRTEHFSVKSSTSAKENGVHTTKKSESVREVLNGGYSGRDSPPYHPRYQVNNTGFSYPSDGSVSVCQLSLQTGANANSQPSSFESASDTVYIASERDVLVGFSDSLKHEARDTKSSDLDAIKEQSRNYKSKRELPRTPYISSPPTSINTLRPDHIFEDDEYFYEVIVEHLSSFTGITTGQQQVSYHRSRSDDVTANNTQHQHGISSNGVTTTSGSRHGGALDTSLLKTCSARGDDDIPGRLSYERGVVGTSAMPQASAGRAGSGTTFRVTRHRKVDLQPATGGFSSIKVTEPMCVVS